MAERDFLTAPDAHLDPVVAAAYDDPTDDMFSEATLGATIAVLAELAHGGAAVEFAVGTGRVGLPLARSGVAVRGIDFSEPMLDQLRAKDPGGLVDVTVGDMTSTTVCDDARLVYLVFNTIMNLRTQDQQVECFRNAAAHLAPGGCFVIETMVPQLRRLPPGDTIVTFDVSARHLGFEEYVDLAAQISISHHYHIDGDRVRTNSPAFRYVWPSELDLMAQLAGMTLESRWADWDRSEFDGESRSHVSVWRKP
ncbi:MAG: class I SAM-dependent methyltransferase [Actinomycetota bacterium]